MDTKTGQVRLPDEIKFDSVFFAGSCSAGGIISELTADPPPKMPGNFRFEGAEEVEGG